MSLIAKSTGYELEAECDQCQSNEMADCPGDCVEPIETLRGQSWIIMKDNKGSVYCFCSADCLKEYTEDGTKLYALSAGEASFDEWDGEEVTGNIVK